MPSERRCLIARKKCRYKVGGRVCVTCRKNFVQKAFRGYRSKDTQYSTTNTRKKTVPSKVTGVNIRKVNRSSIGRKAKYFQKTSTSANISPVLMCNKSSIFERNSNYPNKSTNFPTQLENRKNSPEKRLSPFSVKKHIVTPDQSEDEESHDEESDDEQTDPESKLLMNMNSEDICCSNDEYEIDEDGRTVKVVNNTESSCSRYIQKYSSCVSPHNSKRSSSMKSYNDHNDTIQNASKKRKVYECFQTNLHRNNSSKTVTNVPNRVKNTKSIPGKKSCYLKIKSQKIAKSRKVPTASSSNTSKLTNQVKSLTSDVKRLEREVEELRRTQASDLRNFTAFERNNTSSVCYSRIPPLMRTFVSEEDNSELRKEVKELEKNVSKVQEELNKAKLSKEKRKYKEKLMEEIKSLEKSCEDVDKLREENHSKYLKIKRDLDAEGGRILNIPVTHKLDAEYHRAMIASYKRDLESFEPKPPKPKPDPYKKPEHLEIHRQLRFRAETYEEKISKLQDPVPGYKAVIENSKVCLSNQKKGKYTFAAVLRALKEKHSEVRREWLPPVKNEMEFRKELEEFQKAVVEKAEKEYEEMLQRELKETQPGCSSFPTEPQPGCSRFPTEPQPGCSRFSSVPQPLRYSPVPPGPLRFSTVPPPRRSRFPTEPRPGCSKSIFG